MTATLSEIFKSQRELGEGRKGVPTELYLQIMSNENVWLYSAPLSQVSPLKAAILPTPLTPAACLPFVLSTEPSTWVRGQSS